MVQNFQELLSWRISNLNVILLRSLEVKTSSIKAKVLIPGQLVRAYLVTLAANMSYSVILNEGK